MDLTTVPRVELNRLLRREGNVKETNLAVPGRCQYLVGVVLVPCQVDERVGRPETKSCQDVGKVGLEGSSHVRVTWI